MAVTPNPITKTLIVPMGSEERFVRFAPDHAADGWLGEGITYSGISALKPGYCIQRPACRHHFIGYVLDGHPVYGGTPQERIILSPEQVFFLPAGSFHYYAGEVPFTMIWFHLLATHTAWLPLAALERFHRVARCAKAVAALMELAFDEVQTPPVQADNTPFAVSRVIASYLQREVVQVQQGEDLVLRGRLEKVWQEAGRKLEQDWSVASLARQAGLSVSHFHAAVQKHYKASPMSILRDLRMGRAQALLQHTDYKLEEIARLTGYESAFSLSRTFKAALGCSPKDYKHAHRLRGSPSA